MGMGKILNNLETDLREHAVNDRRGICGRHGVIMCIVKQIVRMIMDVV
jgi:hypothetical protein